MKIAGKAVAKGKRRGGSGMGEAAWGGGGGEGLLLVGIIGLQLLLQSQDLLIPFIQTSSQGNHDVTLF